MQKKIMLDASTIQPVQLQYANEILGWMLQLFNLYNYKMLMIFFLCWMLQLTWHIQLQNECKYKGGAQPLLFVQKKSGWQSVL